jgi:hypothetical protein
MVQAMNSNMQLLLNKFNVNTYIKLVYFLNI